MCIVLLRVLGGSGIHVDTKSFGRMDGDAFDANFVPQFGPLAES